MAVPSSFEWNGLSADDHPPYSQRTGSTSHWGRPLRGSRQRPVMKDHRSPRLNEQFKREISAILARKVRDPRVGHVLVTEVRVTADLWVAKVFFRLLDGDRSPDEVLEGLEAAAPFVRKELGKILRVRRIPEIRFQYDTTIDSADRIERVLREVLPHDTEDGTGEEEAQTPQDGVDEGADNPEGEA